ncbi:mucinmucin-4-like [Octopus vulgaris]|uniref:Mucinmucin-4-like n=1 Tax=Octopus vulgaris TaxID=6645 RepID=A0AA36F4Y6_OCTVU|nr:mucinmucin-4-like [Octopus vulgaris]
MLLVTDGSSTYLLYFYKPCEMDMKIDVKALMGFNLGGNRRFMHKDSLKTNSLVNIDIKEGNTAWMFGDPHIQTLDGLKYSFNGLGEYTLIRVHSKTTGINMLEIQARTAQAKNSNGTLINATIFSAFAMKDFITNAAAQVELAADEKTLVIYHNGIDKTLDFQKDPNYSLTDPDLFISRNSNNQTNQSVSLTFTSGVDVSVTVGIRMLAVTVSLPEGYKNTTLTSGLMGVYNDNKTDDLTTPNGTVLPDTSSERDIFYKFGQRWAIKSSLFKYPKDLSNADFTDTSFVPLFIDKNSEIYNKSLKICNADDNACIYDYIATGDESIAKATESLDKEAKDDFEAARNTAPEISGEETVKIIINATATAILNVTDAENDDITITKQQGGEYFNVSKSGSDITLSIYLMHSNAVNISIVATDGKNASSAEFMMTIVLCSGCSNHGNCREDNPVIRTENFVLQSCDCEDEYAGDNCEKDFDGCSGDPCPGVGKCEDLKPEEHKAQNTSFRCNCPRGYVLSNATSRCLECDENHFGDKCEGDCNICNEKSTERCDKVSGCICNEGWKGSTCEADINECLNASVCSANEDCKNQNGTYECKCQSGYKKEENKCVVIEKCQSLNCPDTCNVNNGTASCQCKRFYELDPATNNTCIAIDKCSPNPCSNGTCQTDADSFKCICEIGYKLANDKLTCKPCDTYTYGYNCNMTCGCVKGSCDSVKGCICNAGYTGVKCDTRIDFCAANIGICDNKTSECVNGEQNYTCVCKDGYFKTESGRCQNDKTTENPTVPTTEVDKTTENSTVPTTEVFSYSVTIWINMTFIANLKDKLKQVIQNETYLHNSHRLTDDNTKHKHVNSGNVNSDNDLRSRKNHRRAHSANDNRRNVHIAPDSANNSATDGALDRAKDNRRNVHIAPDSANNSATDGALDRAKDNRSNHRNVHIAPDSANNSATDGALDRAKDNRRNVHIAPDSANNSATDGALDRAKDNRRNVHIAPDSANNSATDGALDRAKDNRRNVHIVPDSANNSATDRALDRAKDNRRNVHIAPDSANNSATDGALDRAKDNRSNHRNVHIAPDSANNSATDGALDRAKDNRRNVHIAPDSANNSATDGALDRAKDNRRNVHIVPDSANNSATDRALDRAKDNRRNVHIAPDSANNSATDGALVSAKDNRRNVHIVPDSANNSATDGALDRAKDNRRNVHIAPDSANNSADGALDRANDNRSQNDHGIFHSGNDSANGSVHDSATDSVNDNRSRNDHGKHHNANDNRSQNDHGIFHSGNDSANGSVHDSATDSVNDNRRNGSVIVDHTVKTSYESLDALNKTLETIESGGLVVGNVTYVAKAVSLERIYDSDFTIALVLGILAGVIFLLLLLLCYSFKRKRQHSKSITKTFDRVQVDRIRAESSRRTKVERNDIEKDIGEYVEIELNPSSNKYTKISTFVKEDKRSEEIDPNLEKENIYVNEDFQEYVEITPGPSSNTYTRIGTFSKDNKRNEEIDPNWEKKNIYINQDFQEYEEITPGFNSKKLSREKSVCSSLVMSINMALIKCGYDAFNAKRRGFKIKRPNIQSDQSPSTQLDMDKTTKF